MTRQCDSCGGDYEAKRPTSRFCTPKCRVRAARSPTNALDVPTAPATDPATSGLYIATLRELEAASVLNTTFGQLAIEVAARISNPGETGASVASLAKQLRETLAAALDGSEVVASDPLDELRSRRDNKRRIGGR